MKRTFLVVAVVTMATVLFSTSTAYAAHGEATVSDIDFTGNGNFIGSYTHVPGTLGDHPWFVVDAQAGDVLTATMVGTFSGGNSYGWWYQETDNEFVEIGDVPGSELTLLAQAGDSTNYSVVTPPLAGNGQYAFQLDSWNGASGTFDVTISGATGGSALTPEPSTFALAILGLLTLGMTGRRRRRR